MLLLSVYAIGTVLLVAAFGALALQSQRIAGKATRIEHGMNALTRDSARQAARDYRQLEDLQALYHQLRPRLAFPRTRGYPASPDFLRVVMERVSERRPGCVVELGSGVSTLVVGYALEHAGDGGRLYSVDHEQGYLEETRQRVAAHGLTEYVTLIHAPLAPCDTGGSPWYALDPATLPAIDLLVIDGPPAGTRDPEARYPALPQLFDRLAPGATIVVDDAAREGETSCVNRWHAQYPNLIIERVDCEKGCVLIHKPAS